MRVQCRPQLGGTVVEREDLPGLAGRLGLPDGWSYQPRVLASELRVDTRTQAAQVLQDNLTNSYSLETD